MKKLFYLSLLTLCCLSSQSVHADSYSEHAKQVRDIVWAWDKPEFKSYDVPDKYANESAVIIAKHREITVSRKNKFSMFGLLSTGNPNMAKSLNYVSTERFLVKINDNVSLEEYSELSFKERERRAGVLRADKYQTVVGARIIKPDGRVIDVNFDEAVIVTEGKNDKTDYKKLAIPDLQIGDVLDYFFQDMIDVDSYNIPTQNFYFASTFPMLSCSIYCEIGNKLTVEYRSCNGAPELRSSTNNDGNITLYAEKKNIDKIDDSRWVSVLRSISAVRLTILNNTSKVLYKPRSARESGVYKDVPPETILQDVQGYISNYGNTGYKIAKSEVEAGVSKLKKSKPNASNEEIASFIYDMMCYHWQKDYSNYIGYDLFMVKLLETLQHHNIEAKIGLVANRYGARMSDISTFRDIDLLVIANNAKQVFGYPSFFSLVNEGFTSYEGEPALAIAIKKFHTNSDGKINGIEEKLSIPTTSANQNKYAASIAVSVLPDNIQTVVVEREAKWMGNTKRITQPLVTLFEEWDKVKRESLMIDETLMQELEKNRKSRKEIDDYLAFFEKQRNEQKDAFKEEVEKELGFAPKDILAYSVSSLGITTASPDLTYNVKYTLDGLIKKAGNDYIFDIGKLIGNQAILTEEDRTRSTDVYLSYAYTSEVSIQLQIPAGYTIKDVSMLNKNIDNTYGSFTSKAILSGDQLSITTKKVYKKAFIPLADFGQLVKMLDLANEFHSQSVVLTKN